MTERTLEGFELRPATLDDAPSIAKLINDDVSGEIGVPWTNTEEVRDLLTSPGVDPDLAHAVLLDRSSRLAGFVEFHVTEEPFEVAVLVFVRRDLQGTGVSTGLIRAAEERVAAKAGTGSPARMHVSRFASNAAAGRLFASLGYAYVRTFWMMRIDLDATPPAMRVPDGIEIRPFDPATDDARVHAALSQGFADHWGPPFPPFEEWRHLAIDGEGAAFDPGLWFLAVDGDVVAGAISAQTSARDADAAYVGDLAVLRPWRRRGIGFALMQAVFAEAHRRGIPTVELAVDSDSVTGATRLYERAGMRTAYSWEVWEKLLG